MVLKVVASLSRGILSIEGHRRTTARWSQVARAASAQTQCRPFCHTSAELAGHSAGPSQKVADPWLLVPFGAERVEPKNRQIVRHSTSCSKVGSSCGAGRVEAAQNQIAACRAVRSPQQLQKLWQSCTLPLGTGFKFRFVLWSGCGQKLVV